MSVVKLANGKTIPVEMHRARIVQKLALIPLEDRYRALTEAGNNTFLLKNRDVFLDMLTDSGTNAMSIDQQAAMMQADDSYAGSETFFRLERELQNIFGKEYFLPVHQGRAAENLIGKTMVQLGDLIPMNYHFTTAKAHITENGGEVLEIPMAGAFETVSDNPFKGNMDVAQLEAAFVTDGARIPFVRMEAGTNLIGGQPFSLENLTAVASVCKHNNVPIVLDASLLMDNLYFIKVREAAYADWEIADICLAVTKLCDVVYFSARKLGFARGGGICLSDKDLYLKIRGLVPLYEGFLTYGGMSVREMEAIAVGLRETMDYDVISHGPQFIEFMVDELVKRGVPVVTPAGGLGCHVDALKFLSHVNQKRYPAGALAAALYLVSGIRSMERGTLSEQRNPDGTEPLADMELIRLALPRRVFTMSQLLYAVDRIEWLYNNRELVGGLRWIEEPEVLRFFYGRLEDDCEWQTRLMEKYQQDIGEV